MSKVRKCEFVCHNKVHTDITLPNLTPVNIGRSNETKITDLRCSRNQVLLIADYAAHEVIAKQVGANPSKVDGVTLHKNQTIIIRHGSKLNIFQGNCEHTVHFYLKNESSPCQSTHLSEPQTKKPKLGEPLWWDSVNFDHLLVLTYGCGEYNGKIAAFDLDGTIIKTKSGNVFPKDTSDWELANSDVKPKLVDLINRGYKLVIFTNQCGISTGKTTTKDFKVKVENIVKQLNVPIQVFIATSTDIFRKPAPGMWNHLVNKIVKYVNTKECFFVGDAAGRIANWEKGKKKDFSMADRLFAKNLELEFYSPEEFFLNKPEAPYTKPTFDPSKCLTPKTIDICLQPSNKEAIIMVGAPGSGKSHFVKRHLLKMGYVSISRDTLHSWQKCVAAMSDSLSAGKNVVIDNTNPDKESRGRFIKVAKDNNTKIRCFIMDVTIEHCQHNNKFRELTDPSHEKISPVIINQYRKSFVPPLKEEGFEEVVKIPFSPLFNSTENVKLYKMFLL